ncbi:MAG: hypothetical protein ACJASR_001933 [Psychroserpens sp.]|jgi:hypothetical protein
MFDEDSLKVIAEMKYYPVKLDELVVNYGIKDVERCMFTMGKKDRKYYRNPDNYLNKLVVGKHTKVQGG